MQNFTISASKIVFILIAATASGAFLFEVIHGTAVLDNKDFMTLAAAAFGYFFGAQPTQTDSLGGTRSVLK